MKIENASVLAAAIGTLLAVACSPSRPAGEAALNPAPAQSSSAPAKPTGAVPAAVANVGEFAENIFDAAKAKNWSLAQEKLNALTAAVSETRTQMAAKASLESKLEPTLSSVSQAIGKKNSHAAMRSSNELTYIAASLAEPFHPAVPVDINRLDFYGRELEIWSAENNLGKLQSTVREMRTTWDRIRPEVAAHGGQTAVDNFESLVGRAEAAKTSLAFKKVATPVLDEVDKLEKIFEK